MRKHVCPWWFAYTFDNRLRRFFHDPEVIFDDYLKPGMTAIDIGCGMGYFSIGMARMVGESGKVISVDVQQQMLDTLVKRATKAGVASRIKTVFCDPDDIKVSDKVDFALLFWMAHEVTDVSSLLKQIHAILKPSCKLLYTEPKFHVTPTTFKNTLAVAQETGFKLVGSPSICCSYTALFENE